MRAVRSALQDVTAQPKPLRLGVAVSGGGDSMAVLEAARQIANVHAVTVDHGLRPEAAAEAAGVAAFCAARDIPHETLRWVWDGRGNVSARAREARFTLVGGWATQNRLDAVILGHTQDDVAETFLMRLSRGSGVGGLSAMRPRFQRNGTTWLRPFLNVSRADCRSYLRQRGIGWIEDPTNEDPAYLRTRARTALQDLGIGSDTLADTARRLSEANVALNWSLRAYIRETVTEDQGDLLVPATPDLPPELIRRLYALAVRWVGGNAYAPRDVALRHAIKATGTRTLAGCVLFSQGADTRITREYRAVQDLRTGFDAPWDDRWHIDGPHSPDLRVAALGDGLRETPWRSTGVPRVSLIATPAIWQGDRLVAAPLAGLSNGWTAAAATRGKFTDFLGND